MAYCPKDGRPCMDDLCYGGGCLLLQGEPMLDRCEECGELDQIGLSGLCQDCLDERVAEEEIIT